ncbi:MAG: Ribosome recycling factor [Haloplasmataceae bacterium]|jgi:ribosome recycling factor|nr:Ribosome recycling factor [Haloplasmataceae bacterium]
MPETILFDAEERMEKTVDSLHHELQTVRTGRASSSVLDRITVDYYGAPTSVNQMATVSTPEPRLLVIKPYDKSMIKAVEKAILESDLGITPSNDGQVIRIAFPQLTEERRRDLAKLVHKYGEEAKVALRNIRRDANEALKKLEKDKTLTEDGLKSYQDEVQKLTDDYAKKIDVVVDNKEKDILHV